MAPVIVFVHRWAGTLAHPHWVIGFSPCLCCRAHLARSAAEALVSAASSRGSVSCSTSREVARGSRACPRTAHVTVQAWLEHASFQHEHLPATTSARPRTGPEWSV